MVNKEYNQKNFSDCISNAYSTLAKIENFSKDFDHIKWKNSLLTDYSDMMVSIYDVTSITKSIEKILNEYYLDLTNSTKQRAKELFKNFLLYTFKTNFSEDPDYYYHRDLYERIRDDVIAINEWPFYQEYLSMKKDMLKQIQDWYNSNPEVLQLRNFLKKYDGLDFKSSDLIIDSVDWSVEENRAEFLRWLKRCRRYHLSDDRASVTANKITVYYVDCYHYEDFCLNCDSQFYTDEDYDLTTFGLFGNVDFLLQHAKQFKFAAHGIIYYVSKTIGLEKAVEKYPEQVLYLLEYVGVSDVLIPPTDNFFRQSIPSNIPLSLQRAYSFLFAERNGWPTYFK